MLRFARVQLEIVYAFPEGIEPDHAAVVLMESVATHPMITKVSASGSDVQSVSREDVIAMFRQAVADDSTVFVGDYDREDIAPLLDSIEIIGTETVHTDSWTDTQRI